MYPYKNFREITPNNSADLVDGDGNPVQARGIMFKDAATGSLSFVGANGGNAVVLGLAQGIIHPIMTRRIRATGTDVTNIFIFW